MDFTLQDDIAVVQFDDGKANVVGHDFLDGINSALDRAEKEAKAVVLRGREGMFSAGFDLNEFKKGPEASQVLVLRGFRMLHRLYSLPLPLVAACSGHGIALGAFILLASDNRVGVSGEFRISLPETAISMDLPPLLMALATSRLATRYLTRAAVQSETFSPDTAVDAGFLDEVVAADELDDRARAIAATLAQLPTENYARNKLAARAVPLAEMEKFLESISNID